MDFKITSSLISGLLGRGSDSSKSNLRVNNPEATSSSSAARLTPNVSQNGPSVEPAAAVSGALSSIQEFANRASEASDAIAQLRQTQYEYAQKADDLAIGDPQLDYLNTQTQALQDQISSISSATYKGQSLTSGTVLSLPNENGQGFTTSTPNLSAVTSNPNVNLLSPEDAESAVDSLLTYQNSSSMAAGDIQAAANATNAPETKAIEAAKVQEAARAAQAAQEQPDSKEISGKIADKFGNPNSEAELVMNVLNSAYTSQTEEEDDEGNRDLGEA